MIRMSSFWHMRPNCVTGVFPCSNSFSVGARRYTFFQSVYSASGTPYFSIHCRRTRAAAQIVSSSPIRASTVEVASSTMFIRHALAARPSYQSWKLPSICTNSPKCARRSRRLRCALRLRARFHNPCSSIQRRSVSGWISSWSSLARCSAARVGPKPAVFFFHFPQNLFAFFFRPSAVGSSARIAVFQRLSPALAYNAARCV